MDHIDQQKEQLKSDFQKILGQKTIYKADVMRLKKQAKILAEYDSSFNSLRNSITTHVNAMKGVLNEERKTKLTELFEKYFEN